MGRPIRFIAGLA